MESLQALCFAKLICVLLEGRDAELERLPDSIATELLKGLVAVASRREPWKPCAAAALAKGLLTWLRRRPVPELFLAGKWKERAAEKCLALLASPPPSLSRFSALQTLCISHSPSLMDCDLAVLKASRLRTLQLHDCPCITGAFIGQLSGISGSLRRLLCSKCAAISDGPVCAGLGELNLLHLSFSGSVKLTDEVAAVLTGGAAPSPVPGSSSSLTCLDLSQTLISDLGALALGRLELSCLALSRTSVSVPALRELTSRLGLKPLLPNRPKVLLRSYAAAAELEAEILPAWASQASSALSPMASIPLGGTDVSLWPEPAVRHAAALLLFQVSLSSQKRPAASDPTCYRQEKRVDCSVQFSELRRPVDSELGSIPQS